MRGKVPFRVRILSALSAEPDWDHVTTPEQVAALRAAQNRTRRSALGGLATGRTDRDARIDNRVLDLPGRELEVRVYRPTSADTALPLVIAFHGGGLILGEPDQDDWLLSHLAVHTPAVVASVAYRLAPEHPAPAPVDDGYDSVSYLIDRATYFGADRSRVALLGASAGATLAALAAIRAVDIRQAIRTQVLINPQLDWTDDVFDYASFIENGDSPTATPANCRAAQRLAVPEDYDIRAMSPLQYDDLSGLAPALILSAGLDPLEDQSPAYAERLREDGVAVTLTRYDRAVHSFMSMPGLVPAARPARSEILAHLRTHLSAQVPSLRGVS